ncbi:MAG: DUF5719 family protein [Microbacterium arborescens]
MTTRPIVTRLVAGVVTAAVVGGGIAAAVLAPWPEISRAPLGIDVVPEAARSVAACDGPLLALGRDPSAAGAITEAAASAVVSGTESGEPDRSALATPDRADGGSPADVFTAEPADGRPTDLAAASASVLDEPDLRGLAVSACSRPAMESWLVGGSAATGASDLVLLANPGDTPATVDLRVYGADGAQDPVAGREIVVAARTQRAVPLAALRRGEESPVVRVTATGAPVRASLQTTLTRTLIAGGVDQVSAAALPSSEQVIPGVDVTVGPDAVASAGGMSVRLLATSADTSASVVVRSVTDGTVVAQQEGVALRADHPLELELTGMPVGVYTVTAAAAEPVVAAAWTSTDLSAPGRLLVVGGRARGGRADARGRRRRPGSGADDRRDDGCRGDHDPPRRGSAAGGAAAGGHLVLDGCRGGEPLPHRPGGRHDPRLRGVLRGGGSSARTRWRARPLLPPNSPSTPSPRRSATADARGRDQKKRNRSGPRSHGSRSRYSAAARNTQLSIIMRRCRSS